MDLILRCVTKAHRDQQWFLGLEGGRVVLRDPARETVSAFTHADLGDGLVLPSAKTSVRYLHCRVGGAKMQFDVRSEDRPVLDAFGRCGALRTNPDAVPRMRRRGVRDALIALVLAAAGAWLMLSGDEDNAAARVPAWITLFTASALFVVTSTSAFRRHGGLRLLDAWSDQGGVSKPLMTFTAEEGRKPSDGHWVD
jgi:hypothetical protein